MYRTVNDSLWSEPWFEDLSAAGRLTFLYLLTSPRQTPCGVLEISAGRIGNETGLGADAAETALLELEAIGKVRWWPALRHVEVLDIRWSRSSDVSPERRRWQRKAKKTRLKLLARDGAVCRYCGSLDDLTVDHRQPIVTGGSDELDNLQILCRSCNSRKGAR